MTDYKIKINKQLVTDFLINEVTTKQQLREVHKIITAVIIKYYSKYQSLSEELHSACMASLLEKRCRYDLAFSGYNYIFTICRNEIGNYINKQREVIVEDILPYSNASVNDEVVSLPAEINKFKKYLTGDQSFSVLELSSKEAINLILFCESYSHTRFIEPPEFIKINSKALNILYKLAIKL